MTLTLIRTPDPDNLPSRLIDPEWDAIVSGLHDEWCPFCMTFHPYDFGCAA